MIASEITQEDINNIYKYILYFVIIYNRLFGNFIKNPAVMYAQIASDFIGPKVLFCDIERRDSDESIELFCWRNNRRFPEK